MFDVAPSAFVPPPKVTSSVVRLIPRAAPLPCTRSTLERVTAAAFGQRRKMLRQSLRALGVDPALLLAATGIDGARARRRNPGRRIRRTRQRARRSRDAVAGWRRRRKARMTKLRRQSLVAYGAPLCETVVDCPQPQGSEVLVRIERCGVCHSDLHVQDGFFKLAADKKLDISAGRALPFTLGHEIAGVVEAAGPQADIAPGRKVAVYPWIGCGECPACRHGDENLCTDARHLGITVDGGYASHVVVPHPRYLLDYAPLSPSLAGALMCSGLTAYAALKRLADRAARGPLLLVGLGGVGMMGLALARAMYETAPDRRRHRCGQAQCRARGGRRGRVRSRRSRRAQGRAGRDRRRLRRLRFRRLGGFARLRGRRARQGRQGRRHRPPRRRLLDRRCDVPAARHDDRRHVDGNACRSRKSFWHSCAAAPPCRSR